MNKKYEILYDKSIEIARKKLYRIRALISFTIHGREVNTGDEGGYIENENCLSIDDKSWLFNNSIVYNSRVYNSRVDNSRVYNSMVDNSMVDNNSIVYNSTVDNSIVYNSTVDNSTVDNSMVDNSRVDNSIVYNSTVDNSTVDNSMVDNSRVYNSTVVKQTITKQPLALTLPVWHVTIVNNDIRIGCRFYSIEQWDNFTDDEISQMDEDALEWWKTYKESILTLARTIKQDSI